MNYLKVIAIFYQYPKRTNRQTEWHNIMRLPFYQDKNLEGVTFLVKLTILKLQQVFDEQAK